MEKKVLIASSHQPFADLVRHSLLESKKYKLKVVLTKEELQTVTDQQNFDLVILDADLPDQPIVSAASALKENQAGLKLIVFPPENRADHPAIQGIQADAFLKKPFYLPELNETLEQVLTQEHPAKNNGYDIESENDPEAFRYQHILNLIMHDSPATAIMLVKGERPYAFVGELEENSPQQILRMVMPHWNAERRKDVVRFKRLYEGGKDYLFYATAFGPELILIVMYERTISLTSARYHTTLVMRHLKNPPAIWLSSQQTIPASKSVMAELKPKPIAEEADLLTTDDLDDFLDDEELGDLDEAEMIRLEELLASMPNPDPDGQVEEFEAELSPSALWAFETEETDQEEASLIQQEADFEGSAGIPSEQQTQDEEEPEMFAEENSEGILFPWDEQKAEVSAESSVFVPISQGVTTQTEEPDADTAGYAELSALIEEKNEHKPSLSKFETSEESNEFLTDIPEDLLLEEVSEKIEAEMKTAQVEETEVVQPSVKSAFSADAQKTQVIRKELINPQIIPADHIEVNPLEDTAPRIIRQDPEPELEPHAAGLSSLNYTCVLLPRFPDQYLTGLIGENLANWMPQLCIAYGWRLERISIRPRYMQWTLQVAPSVSPGHMVRILRDETSRRIFKIKPELQLETSLNDFWAPGYLVMSGFLPPTQQVLVDFIKQTRRRQGLNLENDDRLI